MLHKVHLLVFGLVSLLSCCCNPMMCFVCFGLLVVVWIMYVGLFIFRFARCKNSRWFLGLLIGYLLVWCFGFT